MGHVLSSRGPERHIVAANTFDAILELDLRQERISDALRRDFWNTGNPPLLGPLTPRQQGQLIELMRTSLWHCDYMADMAAADSPAASSGSCAHTKTRTAQIEYIGSLSTKELAALFYTVDMAGFGFVRACKYEAEEPTGVGEDHGGQASHAAHLIEAGMEELTDWETGKEGMLPGLRMSLVDAYRNRLEDATDVDLEASLRERVRSLVMTPQKT
ncbi:hypothetical protein PG994_011305 [Apiospora phragmitis]|uniref:Uncharacterized protein n=1 Tax=Apiospora phragmitis TaxID=2905665 RepID=A0ABR1TSG7_9PEZI